MPDCVRFLGVGAEEGRELTYRLRRQRQMMIRDSRQGFQIPLKIDICGATAEGEGSPRQLPGNFPDNAVADLCFCHKLLISLRINSGKASDALSRHASQLC
ncbi:hypothetical protein [Brucella melitensis]|uniref:hypothetical protein n=1 Tax=Brucella melitensis TaxID=29459 RepID=UPI0031F30B22